MPVLMRACVHAEMRIGTKGRAECRCASTALLVGKRGLAAEAQALVHRRPPRAIECCWHQVACKRCCDLTLDVEAGESIIPAIQAGFGFWVKGLRSKVKV